MGYDMLWYVMIIPSKLGSISPCTTVTNQPGHIWWLNWNQPETVDQRMQHRQVPSTSRISLGDITLHLGKAKTAHISPSSWPLALRPWHMSASSSLCFSRLWLKNIKYGPAQCLFRAILRHGILGPVLLSHRPKNGWNYACETPHPLSSSSLFFDELFIPTCWPFWKQQNWGTDFRSRTAILPSFGSKIQKWKASPTAGALGSQQNEPELSPQQAVHPKKVQQWPCP